MESSKRVAGWATIASLVGLIVLGILGDRLAMSAKVYQGLKGFLVVVFFISFWAYFGLEVAIEDKERPRYLAEVAPRLGLTYVSKDEPGLPSALAGLTSGLREHVMVGEHNSRKVITCLVTHLDPDGSDYRWRAIVELPSALPDFGITVHKSRIVACRDWPPSKRKRRWVQTRDPQSIMAAVLSDPRMREWLEGPHRWYHFHVHDRWVVCEGPTVMPASAGPGLEAQIRPVVDAATGFVDRIPSHIFWEEGVQTARPSP